MRSVFVLLLAPVLLFSVFSLEADAQGRGRGRGQGQGQGPAFCRNGQGHPVHGWEWCRQRGWGDDYRTRDIRRYPGTSNPRTAIPRRDGVYDRSRVGRLNNVAFDNGYGDGYEKGLDDGRDRREFDPIRHSWYRSANRHYDSSYGSRATYANVYRDGFRSGYQAGFADGDRYGDRNGNNRFPWPF